MMIKECQREHSNMSIMDGQIMPDDAKMVDADAICIAEEILGAWLQCTRPLVENGEIALHDLQAMEEEYFFSPTTPEKLYLCFSSPDGSRILAQLTIGKDLWIWKKTGA